MKTAAQRTKPAIRQKIQIRRDIACFQPGFLIPVLALIIVFLTYLPSFSNEFVWDDYRIQDNPALKNPGRILDLFNPAKYSDTSDEPTYRPLVALARFLDVAVWGYWAPGHRLFNIVLFLIACWLLYWVAWRLFGNIYAAGLAALLFGLHPIQTEAVALIAFRADLLAGLFMLAAVLGYWEFRRNARLRHLLFVTGCYFLAMLGKETAVILPLLFLVFEIHFRNHPDGAFQPFKPLPYLGLAAAGVVYAGLRFLVFVPAQEYLAESYPTGLPAAIGTAVRLFALYLAKFFYPVHLTVWEPFTRSVAFDGPATIGLLMVVLFLAVLIWFYLKDKTVCLGMLWFGVALAPVLQIVIKTPQPFAERWMFVPSMGIALGVAGLAFQIHTSLQTTRRFPPYQTWMPVAVAGMILALLGYRTIFRTFDLKDDLSLWSAVVRVHPENPGTLVSLAGIHINRHDFGKALVYLEKAGRLNPADPLTLANLAGSLAITHYHLENYEQAAKHGEFALASLKKYPKWFNKRSTGG